MLRSALGLPRCYARRPRRAEPPCIESGRVVVNAPVSGLGLVARWRDFVGSFKALSLLQRESGGAFDRAGFLAHCAAAHKAVNAAMDAGDPSQAARYTTPGFAVVLGQTIRKRPHGAVYETNYESQSANVVTMSAFTLKDRRFAQVLVREHGTEHRIVRRQGVPEHDHGLTRVIVDLVFERHLDGPTPPAPFADWRMVGRHVDKA